MVVRHDDSGLSQPLQEVAREDVALPASWQGAVSLPNNPGSLPPADIDANREQWISQWRSVVRG